MIYSPKKTHNLLGHAMSCHICWRCFFDREMSVSCEQIAHEAHGWRRWEGEFPVEAQGDHPATHQALGGKPWGNPAKIMGKCSKNIGKSSKNHGNLWEDLWLQMMRTEHGKISENWIRTWENPGRVIHPAL